MTAFFSFLDLPGPTADDLDTAGIAGESVGADNRATNYSLFLFPFPLWGGARKGPFLHWCVIMHFAPPCQGLAPKRCTFSGAGRNYNMPSRRCGRRKHRFGGQPGLLRHVGNAVAGFLVELRRPLRDGRGTDETRRLCQDIPSDQKKRYFRHCASLLPRRRIR